MSIKYRKIKQAYVICDLCGKEIKDGNYTKIGNKHYHSVWTEENQGNTCLKKLTSK